MSRKAKVGPELKKTTSVIDWVSIASFPLFFCDHLVLWPLPAPACPLHPFLPLPCFFLSLFCSFFDRGWPGSQQTLAIGNIWKISGQVLASLETLLPCLDHIQERRSGSVCHGFGGGGPGGARMRKKIRSWSHQIMQRGSTTPFRFLAGGNGDR